MKVSLVYVNSFFENVYVLNNNNISEGDYIILDSDKGMFLGRVVKNFDNSNVETFDFHYLKKAGKKDLKQNDLINKDALEVLEETKKIASKLGLDMHFVDSIYSFDRRRLYLSFVADSRIDFRELAKRLAQRFHARIEFRQIGVRDKAKKIGGIGPCGLMLCCNTFLSDFDSVSINMAKNQMLALNPNKINGVCGRLKCCLNYENDIYTQNRKKMPMVGDMIDIGSAQGKVIEINVLSGVCKVELSNKNIVDYKVGKIDD